MKPLYCSPPPPPEIDKRTAHRRDTQTKATLSPPGCGYHVSYTNLSYLVTLPHITPACDTKLTFSKTTNCGRAHSVVNPRPKDHLASDRFACSRSRYTSRGQKDSEPHRRPTPTIGLTASQALSHAQFSLSTWRTWHHRSSSSPCAAPTRSHAGDPIQQASTRHPEYAGCSRTRHPP